MKELTIQMKDSETKTNYISGCTDLWLHEEVYNSNIFAVINAFLIILYIKFADILMQWLKFQ